MTKRTKTDLTTGNYRKQILNMSLGMVFGMLGMTIFNMVDTMYVGRLGEEELAALSFTFPVIMIVQSLALGLGVGLSAHLSTTLGEKKFHKAARVTTDGILLAFIIVALVSLGGLLSIRPLFTLLGARGIVLDHIHSYMSIWYFGAMVVVIPMVGNNAIRATGDTKTPSLIMIISASINLLLDPFLIFGLGPFPALGVRGAALATVLARSVSMTSALIILGKREKLLTLRRAPRGEVIMTWKAILFVGLPSALVRMITPLASGIITAMLAGISTAAVAGFGAGTKAERFAMAFTFAVGAAIGPFIGQNRGAGNDKRVREGAAFANKLAFWSGTAVYLILFITARPLSTLFSPVPEIQKVIVLYMRLAGLGYGMQGLFTNSGTILNVMKKPLHAALLSLMQMFIIYLPLAYLGAGHFGESGIFAARALSYAVAGLLAVKVLKKLTRA